MSGVLLALFVELVLQAVLLLVFGVRHLKRWRSRGPVWWLLTSMIVADTARAVGLLLLAAQHPLHDFGYLLIFGFVDVVTFGWLVLQHQAIATEGNNDGNTPQHGRP